jgi:hypothetical protein
MEIGEADRAEAREHRMPKIAAAILALALTAAAGAWAQPGPGQATFKITNDSDRIVECTLLVDGATRTYMRVHPGKTYHDNFRDNRRIQLVCMRGKEGVYGPMKFGADYRFVRDGDHVAVVGP